MLKKKCQKVKYLESCPFVWWLLLFFLIYLVLVIYFVSFVVTPGVGKDGIRNSKCGHQEMLNENRRVGWD